MPLPSPHEPRWYAAYTKSRSEKIALKRLLDNGFEAYLPIQRKRRQWSDRLKSVSYTHLSSARCSAQANA